MTLNRMKRDKFEPSISNKAKPQTVVTWQSMHRGTRGMKFAKCIKLKAWGKSSNSRLASSWAIMEWNSYQTVDRVFLLLLSMYIIRTYSDMKRQMKFELMANGRLV